MRIVKDREKEDSYTLLGLTLAEVQVMRQALERYSTPTATGLFLALRHDLESLGESIRPVSAGICKRDTRSNAGDNHLGIPLIVCHGE